jgi:hypothetical protein
LPKARQCGKDKALNYESIAAAEEAAVQAQALKQRDTKLLLEQANQVAAKATATGQKARYHLSPANRPPSGFYGVRASGKRWQARSNYDSKRHPLGTFDTKQEAALAYDRKARQCGKKFANGKKLAMNYESIAAAEEAVAQAQAQAEHARTHRPGM